MVTQKVGHDATQSTTQTCHGAKYRSLSLTFVSIVPLCPARPTPLGVKSTNVNIIFFYR